MKEIINTEYKLNRIRTKEQEKELKRGSQGSRSPDARDKTR